MALVAFDSSNSPNVPNSPKKGVMVTASLAAYNTTASCDVLHFAGYRYLAVLPTAAMTGVTVYAGATPTGPFAKINDLGTAGSVAMSATTWNSLDPTKIAPYSYLLIAAGGTTGTIQVAAST